MIRSMSTIADILGFNRKPKIPARWTECYARLCEERDRLISRDFSEPETTSAKLDDLTDAAAEETQRSMSLLAASTTKGSIVEVLEAIRLIERGTYGICEASGEPIEPERLEAIPWTRYSLRGQSEAEKEGFGRRVALPGLESPVTEEETSGEEEAEEKESTKSGENRRA